MTFVDNGVLASAGMGPRRSPLPPPQAHRSPAGEVFVPAGEYFVAVPAGKAARRVVHALLGLLILLPVGMLLMVTFYVALAFLFLG